MIRVLLVDDQALLRTGFRMILESEADIEVIGEAADGRAAVELIEHLRPDIVLMDIRMPELDGIEATRLSLRGATATRVVILTTFDLDDYVYDALRAGASGFLLKDTPAETLIDAVRVVARGDALLAPSITRRLISEFAQREGASRPAPIALDQLTERENEVLLLMARGLSNAEIAQTLILGETTIKTHVGRVLTKLGVRDRVQAVIRAYESGLVIPGQ